jgi:GT2 family glycosyltransferase
MADVVVVIPTLAQNVPRLNAAIDSVRKFTNDHAYRIVVVNNSPLPAIDGLAEVEEVLSPRMNVGYVGALEMVRRSYEFTYLWSVQDDMTLTNDVLDHLVLACEATPSLAVASPVLVRDGLIPARTRGGIFTNAGRTQWENIPLEPTSPEDLFIPENLSFVSGSGALFRKSALDTVGGFNLELYPLMHVDVDICARFLHQGFDITLVPTAHIEHEIQGSTTRLLSEVLYAQNTPVVEKVLANPQERIEHRNEALDGDLVYAIAQKSSRLIIDLVHKADQTSAALHEESAALHEEIVELRDNNDELRREILRLTKKVELFSGSSSWRWTRPARALTTWTKRIFRIETS